jgi:hypothetical protein
MLNKENIKTINYSTKKNILLFDSQALHGAIKEGLKIFVLKINFLTQKIRFF